MGVWQFVKLIVSDIIDFICPEVCMGCGRRFRSDKEHLICTDCLMSLPKTNHFANDENYITNHFYAMQVRIEFGGCFLQFRKGDITQSLLHNIKYYNHPDLGVKLGRMAASHIKRHHRFEDVDYLVPVPMHPDKQKVRGFNQAERIAFGIQQVMGVPICEDVLFKVVNSSTQTRMTKDQREENSKRIFQARRVEDLAEKHFLIIDDVCTTGATLLWCAQKLKEAMPECKISIFALAKA